MNLTAASWFKTLAIVAVSVASSLTPVYGHDKWYAAVYAVAGALALAANSVFAAGLPVPPPLTPAAPVPAAPIPPALATLAATMPAPMPRPNVTVVPPQPGPGA